MDVKFKFELGQKVKMPSNLEGEVTCNSVSEHVDVNQILVEYFDNNGARFTHWFDEDKLEAVE